MPMITVPPLVGWAVLYLQCRVINRPEPPPDSLLGVRLGIHSSTRHCDKPQSWKAHKAHVDSFNGLALHAGWRPRTIPEMTMKGADSGISIDFDPAPEWREFPSRSVAVRLDVRDEEYPGQTPRGVVLTTCVVTGAIAPTRSSTPKAWHQPALWGWQIAKVSIHHNPPPCRTNKRVVWYASPELTRQINEPPF